MIIEKDPNAILPYFVDWTAWLGTDTIVTSTWTTTLTASNPQVVNGTKAVVTLAGGVVGNSYTVVNHITTANGLQDDRTLVLYITEK